VTISPIFPQPPAKTYYPSHDDDYWFELQNDLQFTEEFTLPGYTADQLGKLEYPTLAIDKQENVYVAYNYTSPEGGDGIYLIYFRNSDIKYENFVNAKGDTSYLKITQEPNWQGPYQMSTKTGIEYRPRISIGVDGTVWIVWSAKRDGKWNIFARTFSNNVLGEEKQLTKGNSDNLRPVVLATNTGRVWVAWERAVDKHMKIVAKYFDGSSWSDESVIEGRSGYAYRPTMIEAPGGKVWFAWDQTTGHNTEVYIRQHTGTRWDKSIRVSTHPGIDAKPALTWHEKKLWVAWTTNRRGTNGWGIIRYPIVRAFDGSKWYEPVSEIKDIDLVDRSETQSMEYSTLTFDPNGRLYLFNRHDHVFNGSYYENGEWSKSWLMDEEAWGQRGLYVHNAWLADGGLWLARRDRKSIYLQKMERLNPTKSTMRLKKYTLKKYPETLGNLAEDTKRVTTRDKKYQVFFGELHVHTAYSDGSGSLDELYNLYKNIYKIDFLAITEHDALGSSTANHFSPSEWTYNKTLNEVYNKPGEFVTFNAYEWTHSTWSGRQDSTVDIGHKNVFFKGGEDSPFFSHFGDKAYDARSLFKTLHDHDALAVPHHQPWSGMVWEDNDPEIETNYEMISIHGANEYMGNLPIPHRGGKPGTFAQNGLAKGVTIGFVGASDSHGLYYHATEGWREDAYKGGLTGVLLPKDETLTRASIWQALKERRNYATSGEKYFLEFSVNGEPMGSEIISKTAPRIAFRALSNQIIYAYIIRDNEELFITGPVGGTRWEYRGLVDETVKPGKHFYYLRVTYKNGMLAWSSPIWVDYKP